MKNLLFLLIMAISQAAFSIVGSNYTIDADIFLDNGWQPPVGGNPLYTNTGYDYDSSIYLQNWGFHHGAYDLVAGLNDPVFAIDDGVVKRIERRVSSTENLSIIYVEHQTSDGTRFLALYGHVYAVESLTEEQPVYKGQHIGNIRRMGTPDHIHFSISTTITDYQYNSWGGIKGGIVDPIEFIKTHNNVRAKNTACAFEDVDSTDPAYKAIQFLCEREIVQGYYNNGNWIYKPNQPITRLELAKIAVLSKANADGKDIPSYMVDLRNAANEELAVNPNFLSQFSDKASLTIPVVWDELGGIIYYVSHKNKIIEGRQDASKNLRYFAPQSDITRGEAIKVFATTLDKTSKLTECFVPYTNITKQYGFCPHINALYWANGIISTSYLAGLVRGNPEGITDKYFNSNLRRGEMAILGCNAIAISEGLNPASTCLSESFSCFSDQSLVGEKFIYKAPEDGEIFADDALARVSLFWSDNCQKNWAAITPAPVYADELLSGSATVMDDSGQSRAGAYICQNKEGLDSMCSPMITTGQKSCAYAVGTLSGYTGQAVQDVGGITCIDNGQYPTPDYIHVEHDSGYAGSDVNHTVVFSGEDEIGRFQDLQTGDGRYTYVDPSDTLTSLERGYAEDRYNCDISLEDFKSAFNIPGYKTEYGIPCFYARKAFIDFMSESRDYFTHEAVLFIDTNKKTASAWFNSPDYQYWTTQAEVMPKLENAGLDLSDNRGAFYFSPAVGTFLWYNNAEGLLNSVSTVYYEPKSTGGVAHIVKDSFLKTLIAEGFNTADWCKVIAETLKGTGTQCESSSKEESVAAYLGFPTSDEADAAPYEGQSGRYQNFVGGQIYNKTGRASLTPAYYVYGPTATVLNTSARVLSSDHVTLLDETDPMYGQTGSYAYGFPQELPKYYEEYDGALKCIAQDFSSGFSITTCGDDFAGVAFGGEYVIEFKKTQDLIDNENFKEGFYDTFAEIGIYGIAFELIQEVAFDKALHLFSKLSAPIGKRFGKTLVVKISKKVSTRMVPLVGWVLLGVDVAVTKKKIDPLIESCNASDTKDGKPPEYYCGKALAYGLFIGALGTSEFASPVANSMFGVDLSSNDAINGKSSLFEQFPTVDPNRCSRTKFNYCDLFGGQKDFERKMEKLSTSQRTEFFKELEDKLDGPSIGIISNATNPYNKALDLLSFSDVKNHLKNADSKGISSYLSNRDISVEEGALSNNRLYDKNGSLKPSTAFEFSSLLYRNRAKSSDKIKYKYLSEKNDFKNPDFEEICDGEISRILESKQIQATLPVFDNLYDNVFDNGFKKRIPDNSLRPEHRNKPMEILVDVESPNLQSDDDDGINSKNEAKFLQFLNDPSINKGIVKPNDTVTIRTKYDIYEYSYTSSGWTVGSSNLCK